MAIFLTADSKVIVQGMTGSEGRKHTQRMLASGTAIVGGVNPKKAGQNVDFDGASVPVFGGVAEAMKETGADVSVIFVPPPFAKAAVIEAVDAQIGLAVVITEGIPVHDSTYFWAHAQGSSTRIIGPNCPGALSPGKASVGIIPAAFFKEGNVGVVSRSGTLTYEAVFQTSNEGLGQTTAVGIGGDPVKGTEFIDMLEMFLADEATQSIIMIGEIGGSAEEEAAAYIADHVSKPVVAYIAGFTAPPGKTMGHAGAIVSGSQGTAAAKAEALESRGVRVGRTPTQVAEIAVEILGG